MRSLFGLKNILLPGLIVMMLVSSAIVPATDIVFGQDSPSNAASTPEAEPDVHFSIRAANTDGASYFEDVEVHPGDSVTLEVELINWAHDPVDIRVYNTNARNAANGGFLAGGADEEKVGSAAWVEFPTQELTLEGSSSRFIAFEVSVPDATEPGQYISSLVAETTELMAIPGEDNLEQQIRYAISVGILVPGEMSSTFELGEPVLVADSLEIPITNTGNHLVRPEGELELRNASGEVVLSSPLQLGSIYAGNETVISLGLPVQLPEDEYSLSLTLTDPESEYTASLEDTAVTVVDSEAVAAASAVSVASVSIEPNDVDIVYADVELVLFNEDLQMPVNVVLSVYRDGDLIEDVALATNQVFLVGENVYTARYLPADMWEPGTYTFTVSVHAVDPETDQEMVLLSEDLDSEIIVP